MITKEVSDTADDVDSQALCAWLVAVNSGTLTAQVTESDPIPLVRCLGRITDI